MRTLVAGGFVWRHADDPTDPELEAELLAKGCAERHVRLATTRNVVTLAERDEGSLFAVLQILGVGGRLFQLSLFVDDESVVSVLGPRPETFDEDTGELFAESLASRALDFTTTGDVVASAFSAI
ncbi:MAG: hypothetical protein ACLGHT_06585, partial [Acidimicrobiia bacterium]